MPYLDRAISGLLVAFIFAGPLLISPWAFDHAILVKESFLLLISGILLMLFFLGATDRATSLFLSTPLAKPIILIVLFAILSLSKAVNLYAASYRLALFLTGVSLYCVATHTRIKGDEIRAFANAAVASGLIAALYAVFQFAGLDPFPPSAVGLTSTLGNPNFLAEYLAFAILLCLGLMLSSEGTREKRLLGLAIIVLVAGLLLSKAKAASLGLVFSMVLFGSLLRHHGMAGLRGELRRFALYAVICLIMAGLFVSLSFSQSTSREGITGALRGYASSQSVYFNFETQYIKGRYAEQGGDVEAALKAYEKAREVYPLYSKPLQRIGIIREGQGDVQGAMAAYQEAIRLNPAFAGASNNLAVLFSSQGNLDEAIQVWEESAKRNPNDLIVAGNLVSAYRIKGDHEKALSWEERVRRLRMKGGS